MWSSLHIPFFLPWCRFSYIALQATGGLIQLASYHPKQRCLFWIQLLGRKTDQLMSDKREGGGGGRGGESGKVLISRYSCYWNLSTTDDIVAPLQFKDSLSLTDQQPLCCTNVRTYIASIVDCISMPPCMSLYCNTIEHLHPIRQLYFCVWPSILPQLIVPLEGFSLPQYTIGCAYHLLNWVSMHTICIAWHGMEAGHNGRPHIHQKIISGCNRAH